VGKGRSGSECEKKKKSRAFHAVTRKKREGGVVLVIWVVEKKKGNGGCGYVAGLGGGCGWEWVSKSDNHAPVVLKVKGGGWNVSGSISQSRAGT